MFYLISNYKANTKVEIRLLYSLAKVNGKVNTNEDKDLHCTGFQKISARFLEVSLI